MRASADSDDVHVGESGRINRSGDRSERKFSAVVGKGVCFDAGGLNLKPTGHIEDMQLDMGGAAAVLGAMDTLAKMNAPVNLVAAIPAVENMVGSKAYRPGSILKSFDVGMAARSEK